MPLRLGRVSVRGPRPLSEMRQPDRAIVRAQMDGDPRGAGVARNVGQRLLHDAEQVRFGLIRQAAVESGSVIDLDAGALAETRHQPAQARVETEIVEDGGAQKLGQLAHVGDGLLHQLDAIVQARLIERIGGQGRKIAFDGGKRAAQLVVQFMREAARDRLPGFPAGGRRRGSVRRSAIPSGGRRARRCAR